MLHGVSNHIYIYSQVQGQNWHWDNWEGFFSCNYTNQPSVKAYAVHTCPIPPPPQHFFKEEEISFDYLPWREGGSKKLIKGVKVWCRRRSSEKGGWHFSYLIFSRFITFIFTNYFTLRLCIWKKTIFFCLHNFIKKGHSKLSKMNLKISHKLR